MRSDIETKDVLFVEGFMVFLFPLHVKCPDMGHDVITTSKLPPTSHHECSISRGRDSTKLVSHPQAIYDGN